MASPRRTILCATLALLTFHLALGIAGEARGAAEVIAFAVEAPAAVAILVRAAVRKDERIAWALIGLGVAAWATGDAVYWWHTNVSPSQDVYPPIVDAIYSLYYVFAAVGLVLLMRSTLRALRFSPGVAVAALAVATSLSWLIFSNVASSGDVTGDLVTAVYPILDLSLIAVLLTGFVPARTEVPRAFVLLGAAFLLTGIADATVAAETLSGDYAPGAWIDSVWPLAVALFGLAAWTDGTFAPSRRFETALSAGLLAAGGGGGLTILVWDQFDRVNPITLALGVLTLLAAVSAGVVLASRFRGARDAVTIAERDSWLRSQLLDQVDAAVIATDRESRLAFWSDGAERLLGWTREQAIGKTSLELGAIDPGQMEDLDAVRARARGGETVTSEVKVKTSSGRTFDGLYRVSPLRDAEGETIGAVGVVVDVTEKKQIEHSLAARADQQGAVAELGRLAAAERDVDVIATAAANVVRRILGIEFVRVLESEPGAEFFAVKACEGWEDEYGAQLRIPLAGSHAGFALGSVEPVVLEDRSTEERFPGSPHLRAQRIVSGVAVSVHGPDGPCGVVTAHSRSQRQFTDDEVAFLEAVASVVGAAITRERADRLLEQLRQAQKLEDVGRLTGGIAHDFNNLLALILNYVSFVHDELPAGQHRSDLGEALKATRSAAELTERLLLFSRQDVREPEVIDLNGAIADMIALLHRTLGEDVVIESALGDDLELVKADASEIQQVLLNLAVNARDAMPHGGRLRIETENAEVGESEEVDDLRPGRYVRLSVADTGTGMSEEVRRRAFDPFFTTKVAGRGTGLGLGIVDSIARESGGRAFLETSPGRGTRVSILFPVTAGTPDGDGPEPAGERPGTGQTVLVVEDEIALRRLAERILRRGGYNPVLAESATDALEKSRQFNGDLALVLTDIVMPEMSGVELAHRLRANHPETAIAVMSGYAGDLVAEDFPNGSLTFIDKPFDASTLLAKVTEALGRD